MSHCWKLFFLEGSASFSNPHYSQHSATRLQGNTTYYCSHLYLSVGLKCPDVKRKRIPMWFSVFKWAVLVWDWKYAVTATVEIPLMLHHLLWEFGKSDYLIYPWEDVYIYLWLAHVCFATSSQSPAFTSRCLKSGGKADSFPVSRPFFRRHQTD